MAKTLPHQEAFTYGEITPKLYGRIGSEGYKQGVKEVVNWITRSAGSIELRDGFQGVGLFNNLVTNIIVMPGDEETFVMFLNDTTMYGYTLDGDTLTLLTVTFTAAYPYTVGGGAALIRVAFHPKHRTVVLFHKNFPFYRIYDNGAGLTFNSLSITAAPAEWTSVSANYPICGCFHESRMWVSGCRKTPSRIWASVSDTYTDFTTGSADTAALDFSISVPANIRWMASSTELLVGTDRAELLIKSEAGVLTPSDIRDKVQSIHGSAAIEPINLGDSVIFVAADKRRLFEIEYSWEAEKWVSKPFNYSAEHLFPASKAIAQIAMAGSPLNILGVRFSDGTMVTATYDRAAKTLGWHQHYATDSELLLLVSALDISTGEAVLLMEFDRSLSTGYYPVELLRDGQNRYLDNWLDVAVSGTSLTGCQQLAGRIVAVIYNPDRTGGGEYIGQVTISAGGTATLPKSVTGTVTVGIPYHGWIVTLPRIQPVPQGSTGPMMKRPVRAHVLLDSSAYPTVNGRRIKPVEHAAILAGTGSYHSGLAKVGVNGWDQDALLTIYQAYPYKTSLTAIHLEMVEEIVP